MSTRSESAAPAQAASNSDSKPLTEIPSVLEALAGTSVYDALLAMEASYRRISREQDVWYEKTRFFCPDACGRCCMGFEPDLFEGEALYMAAPASFIQTRRWQPTGRPWKGDSIARPRQRPCWAPCHR